MKTLIDKNELLYVYGPFKQDCTITIPANITKIFETAFWGIDKSLTLRFEGNLLPDMIPALCNSYQYNQKTNFQSKILSTYYNPSKQININIVINGISYKYQPLKNPKDNIRLVRDHSIEPNLLISEEHRFWYAENDGVPSIFYKLSFCASAKNNVFEEEQNLDFLSKIIPLDFRPSAKAALDVLHNKCQTGLNTNDEELVIRKKMQEQLYFFKNGLVEKKIAIIDNSALDIFSELQFLETHINRIWRIPYKGK